MFVSCSLGSFSFGLFVFSCSWTSRKWEQDYWRLHHFWKQLIQFLLTRSNFLSVNLIGCVSIDHLFVLLKIIQMLKTVQISTDHCICYHHRPCHQTSYETKVHFSRLRWFLHNIWAIMAKIKLPKKTSLHGDILNKGKIDELIEI